MSRLARALPIQQCSATIGPGLNRPRVYGQNLKIGLNRLLEVPRLVQLERMPQSSSGLPRFSAGVLSPYLGARCAILHGVIFTPAI